MHNQSPIVCLMGPTGVGKTALALDLCDHLPCSIISVDSALVYQGMDIGTAKPDIAIRQSTPHYLIDIRAPHETYSVAQFVDDCHQAIAVVHAQGRIPLLVGGTMLYFRALRDGISPLPAADSTVRASIEHQGIKHGWQHLHAQLTKVDPVAAARIHRQDRQRIARALEVYTLTGVPMSQLQAQTHKTKPYAYTWVTLWPADRTILHERISQRFDRMLEQGFIKEVQSLRENPRINRQLPSMRSLGYRQVWDYLAGDCDYASMRDKAIIASRQFAKRQLTWLRHWPDLHRIGCDEAGALSCLLKLF